MRSTGLLSVPDKLLIAAYSLEVKGRQPFSAEDLVVAAWSKYPDTFGLAGYPNEKGQLIYPDSNRVFAEIMGSKPIRKRGFLEKVGSKMYSLTAAGRERAQHLANRSSSKTMQKAALSRDIELELKRLLASKAYEKIKNNRVGDITFYEACSFWGISPRSSSIEFEGRIANFKKIIDSAYLTLQGNAVSFAHNQYGFASDDLRFLLNTHDELLNRFQTEVKVIMNRKDER